MSENILQTRKKILKSNLIWDAGFVTSFVLLTVYSHLMPVPIYVIEPMRIILILSLLYTKKANQYLMASILPLLSFAISGHPPIEKSLIIIFELNLNVVIFWILERKFRNIFLSFGFSILSAKVAYYLIKFFVFSFIIGETFSLEGERLFQQIFIIAGLSGIGWLLNIKATQEKI